MVELKKFKVYSKENGKLMQWDVAAFTSITAAIRVIKSSLPVAHSSPVLAVIDGGKV